MSSTRRTSRWRPVANAPTPGTGGGEGGSGEVGPQGPPGEDGEDGADGADGAPGVDGDLALKWINIEDHGAVGDGATDNRTAIRAAIVAALAADRPLYVPPGVFASSRDPNISTTAVGSMCCFDLYGISNLEIFGAGRTSILKMLDPDEAPGDFYIFRIRNGTSGITIRDLALDGGFPYGTSTSGYDEQIHLVNIGRGGDPDDGASDIRFQNVHFQNCRGDGVRIIGWADGLVTDVSIASCRFDACHRSGIGVQRGSHGVQIHGCLFTRSTDQDIDFEPTGDDGVERFSIVGNHFIRSGDGLGLLSITLSGNSTTVHHERSIFANNVIEGGSIDALNMTGVLIQGNRINHRDAADGDPTIALHRTCRDIQLVDNYVYRSGVAGPGIHVYYQDDTPERILVQGNTITQTTASSGITVDNSHDVAVKDNLVILDNSEGDPVSAAGISLEALGFNCEALTATGNRIRSIGDDAWVYGIQLRAETYEIADAVIANNHIDAMATSEIWIAGNFTNLPIITENRAARILADAGFDTPYIVTGNSEGPRVIVGAGDPEGAVAAPVGSQYQDVTGGLSYTKETGTGDTGWVAQSDRADALEGDVAALEASRTAARGAYHFSTAQCGTSASTFYMRAEASADVNAAAFEGVYVVPAAANLTKLRIYATTPALNNTLHTFTVRKNGVATALVVALAGDTTPFTGSDTDSIAVVEGDLISVEIAKASTVSGGVQRCWATVIFQPTT
jgi:hypothetical protein